jgi:hypothetical protein
VFGGWTGIVVFDSARVYLKGFVFFIEENPMAPWASRFFFFLAILLGGLGGYRLFMGDGGAISESPNALLFVEWSEDLGPVPFGDNKFQIQVKNGGKTPVTILGLAGGCISAACVSDDSLEHIVLNPGQVILYPLNVRVRAEDAFELTISLNYQTPQGLMQKKSTIRGVGLAMDKKGN